MGIILKDWYGKDKTYNHDRIWVRDTEGGLVPFTKGTGEVALEALEVTENGSYTPPDGVDGFNSVEVNVQEEGNVFILSNYEVTGFADDSTQLAYSKALTFGTDLDTFELVVGAEYTVGWDDELYTTVAKDTGRVIEENAGDGSTAYHVLYYLGNGTLLNFDGLEGTGESFAILYTSGTGLTIVTTDTAESHVLGLIKRSRPREVLDMMLESITVTENGTYTADPVYDGLKSVVVEVAGAGVSDDVRYVTFMSHDGLTEYGKKAVAVGDDCADPIARGIFDTPTRESDAQNDYTHVGWATEPNGAAVSDWNKAITEDKTVYAAFASAVRYYTITYYDEDGTTVLNTKSVAYGSVPSYIPTKDGYKFKGWTPEIAVVTGETSYVASWSEVIDFASCSWDKIAEYAESGEAVNVFAVGATKSFTVGSVTANAKIIGFNQDDLSDGSGKAGITLELDCPATYGSLVSTLDYNNAVIWAGSANTTSMRQKSWDDCDVRKYWNNTSYLLKALPDELTAVIKQVKKKYYDIPNAAVETTDDYLWAISMSELGFSLSGQKDEGDCYEGYTKGKISGVAYTALKKYVAGTAVTYRTRSKWTAGIDTLRHITDAGAATTFDQGAQGKTSGYAFPCFCI